MTFKKRNPLAVGWRAAPSSVDFWVPTHQLKKSFPKAAGKKVVDYRIDGRAEVKQHAGKDMHVLEDVVQVVGPISDETPQESVNMEWSPADSKGQHHNSCSKYQRRVLKYKQQFQTRPGSRTASRKHTVHQ